MQALVGRLTALDSEASETLKVVAFFDALVAAAVGLDGLLRAAAVLSGTVAGADRRGRVRRFDSSGRRLEADAPCERRPLRGAGGVHVWLEREGTLHANDEMVVERLALAVELLESRLGTSGGLEIVLDADRGEDERRTALARLRVNAGTQVRLVATRVDQQLCGMPSTVVPTKYGMLRATLDTACTLAPKVPAGIGLRVKAERAAASWDSAVIAFRLTDATDPVLDATDLGAMIILARAHEDGQPHDDVSRLAGLDGLEARVLRAIVDADSIRSAASRLGMHHSSVQARHEALTRALGYDPRTTAGRVRYVAAELLRRLAVGSPHFS